MKSPRFGHTVIIAWAQRRQQPSADTSPNTLSNTTSAAPAAWWIPMGCGVLAHSSECHCDQPLGLAGWLASRKTSNEDTSSTTAESNRSRVTTKNSYKRRYNDIYENLELYQQINKTLNTGDKNTETRRQAAEQIHEQKRNTITTRKL